jgi:ABC-2 type transport system permease protein
MLALATLPAAILAAIITLQHIPQIPYATYTFVLQVPIVVFLAAQGPELITSDVRFRVLALYFSRPLSRAGYAAAKLAALATGLLVVLAVPMLVIYLAGVLALATGPRDVWDQTGGLLAGLAGAAMHAALLAALGLAIAAHTRRYVFGVLSIIGAYLVTVAIFGILEVAGRGTWIAQYAGLLAPFPLLNGIESFALGAPAIVDIGRGPAGWLYLLGGAAALAGAVGVLLLRYRSIDA